MYTWDPNPKDWRGSTKYKFDSARNPYLNKIAKDAAAKGPRTYSRRADPGKLVDPRGKTITSESLNPIVVAVDVTGSMEVAPGEFFDRAPLIYQTLSQYRPDVEISFSAIGDATCDNFPLQVNSFGKGLDLEDHIKAIGCEGGGGGQVSESYELFGYFMQNHCKTPKATSPFLFIFGDEKFYNTVDPDQVRGYIGDKMQSPMKSGEVWNGLLQRFNLYFLQKKYGSGDNPNIDGLVKEHLADAIGRERVIQVPSIDRSVDIILGIVAKQWGQFGDFEQNLSARQADKSVRDSVYASIRYVADAGETKSRTIGSKKAKSTTSLSEMYNDAKGGKK